MTTKIMKAVARIDRAIGLIADQRQSTSFPGQIGWALHSGKIEGLMLAKEILEKEKETP